MKALFLTERNEPLITTEVQDKPVITLENYTKWYDIYQLMPCGKVIKVPVMEILKVEKTMANNHIPFRVDHVWHPSILPLLAKQMDCYYDEQAHEVLVGRWVMEVKGDDYGCPDKI